MSVTFTGGIYNLLSPSGARTYKVTLENTGTVDGIISIDATLVGKANGWGVEPSQQIVTVEPKSSIVVSINVTAPSIETSLMDLNITVTHDGSQLESFSVVGLAVIKSTTSTTTSASQSQASPRLIDPIILAIILGGIGILMIGAFFLIGRKGSRTEQNVEEKEGASGTPSHQHQTQSGQFQSQTQSIQPQQMVQPAQGGYPTQGAYPPQGAYTTQGGYPAQGMQPTHEGYHAQSAYPSQSGYPIQNSNPAHGGGPVQATMTPQAADPQAAAFAALGVSTEQTTQDADETTPPTVEATTQTTTETSMANTNALVSEQATGAETEIKSTASALIETTRNPAEVKCITCLTAITNQQSWVPCSSCGQYHHWACSQSQPVCRYCHQPISSPAS